MGKDMNADYNFMGKIVDSIGAITTEPNEKPENINDEDSIKDILGKIKGHIANLKDVAYTKSYNDLNDLPALGPYEKVGTYQVGFPGCWSFDDIFNGDSELADGNYVMVVRNNYIEVILPQYDVSVGHFSKIEKSGPSGQYIGTKDLSTDTTGGEQMQIGTTTLKNKSGVATETLSEGEIFKMNKTEDMIGIKGDFYGESVLIGLAADYKDEGNQYGIKASSGAANIDLYKLKV